MSELTDSTSPIVRGIHLVQTPPAVLAINELVRATVRTVFGMTPPAGYATTDQATDEVLGELRAAEVLLLSADFFGWQVEQEIEARYSAREATAAAILEQRYAQELTAAKEALAAEWAAKLEALRTELTPVEPPRAPVTPQSP